MAAINRLFTPGSVEALKPMPGTFYKFHSYILWRLNVDGWVIRNQDIADYFNVSLSTVRRALRWFRDNGYAIWDEVKDKWHFFADRTPTHASTKNLDVCKNDPPHEVNNDPPYKEESLVRKELQHTAQKIRQTKPVVVSLEKEEAAPLVFPSGLNEPQRKDAKARIKKAPLDMQQAILIVLAANMAKGTVKNPIGYLNTLITSAHAGTFSPIDSPGGARKDNPNIAKTDAKLSEYREHKASKPDIVRGFMPGLRAALRV